MRLPPSDVRPSVPSHSIPPLTLSIHPSIIIIIFPSSGLAALWLCQPNQLEHMCVCQCVCDPC